MLLGAADIERRRYAAGTWDSTGSYVRGATTVGTISASVQPLNGKDTKSLEEGERASDWRKVYTASDLEPVDQTEGADAAGDRLLIDGLLYEVRTVAPWPFLLAHNRARVCRVQEGAAE